MRFRFTTALLAASLLANAIFVATSLRHRSASATASSAADHSGPQRNSPAHDPAASSGESISPEAAAALGSVLNSRDPARLRDLLQAAGVEHELLKQLVAGAVWKSYEPRFKTLQPENDPAVWWKNAGDGQLSPIEQRARNQRSRELQREIQAKIDSLLGAGSDIPDLADNPWLQRRYGALPPDKAASLQRIESDYQELIGDLRQTTSDFELSADREAIRLLKAERERDIAALLTPEERAAHALRSSATADRLRWRMTQLDATEAEYLQIFPLQKAFDQQFQRDEDHSDGLSDEPDHDEGYWDRRRAAQDELNRQIRAVIGEERYLTAQKQQDQDYTTAAVATARLGLAADTPERLYALRNPAIADSQKIATDPALSADQKKAALKQIAATTRAQVEQTLGAEAAAVYFKRGAMDWLNQLDRGSPLELSSEGRVESGPRIK